MLLTLTESIVMPVSGDTGISAQTNRMVAAELQDQPQTFSVS